MRLTLFCLPLVAAGLCFGQCSEFAWIGPASTPSVSYGGIPYGGITGAMVAFKPWPPGVCPGPNPSPITITIDSPWITVGRQIRTVTLDAGWFPLATDVLSNPTTSYRNAKITMSASPSAAVSGDPGVYFFPIFLTQAPNPEPANFRETRLLYQGILGRDPDLAGFAFWSSQAGVSVADGLMTSSEGVGTAYLPIALYQGFFGRVPSYLEWLATQGYPATSAAAQSPLYYADPQTIINALYQNLLSRAPTNAEFLATAAAGQTWQNVHAQGFAIGAFNYVEATQEWRTRTNPLWVLSLYFSLLGRDADLGGYSYWLGTASQLGAGLLFSGNTAARQRIEAGFVGSGEFGERFR